MDASGLSDVDCGKKWLTELEDSEAIRYRYSAIIIFKLINLSRWVHWEEKKLFFWLLINTGAGCPPTLHCFLYINGFKLKRLFWKLFFTCDTDRSLLGQSTREFNFNVDRWRNVSLHSVIFPPASGLKLPLAEWGWRCYFTEWWYYSTYIVFEDCCYLSCASLVWKCHFWSLNNFI